MILFSQLKKRKLYGFLKKLLAIGMVITSIYNAPQELEYKQWVKEKKKRVKVELTQKDNFDMV